MYPKLLNIKMTIAKGQNYTISHIFQSCCINITDRIYIIIIISITQFCIHLIIYPCPRYLLPMHKTRSVPRLPGFWDITLSQPQVESNCTGWLNSMEKCCTSLVHCEVVDVPHIRPQMYIVGVFFVVSLNIWLINQSSVRRFNTDVTSFSVI